jgi:hypothetical protein
MANTTLSAFNSTVDRPPQDGMIPFLQKASVGYKE